MSFTCKDLDSALAAPDLPADVAVHAETCESCRERIELWSAISEVAPQLHTEWDSPLLWPRIQNALEAESRPKTARPTWYFALAAAAALLLTVGLYRWWPATQQIAPNAPQTFLTAETLQDVQRAEAAYIEAIGKLSSTADPLLQNSSTPLAAMYREKLLVLDSAIADLKGGLETNRYNVYLQTQLAALYQEKQKTLEEWLDNAQSN